MSKHHELAMHVRFHRQQQTGKPGAARIVEGITGSFSQSQTSITLPSGSWKKSCSTTVSPSRTRAATNSSPMSPSLAFMSPMSVHCMPFVNEHNRSAGTFYY